MCIVALNLLKFCSVRLIITHGSIYITRTMFKVDVGVALILRLNFFGKFSSPSCHLLGYIYFFGI